MKKLIVIGIIVIVTAYVMAPYQAMYMLILSIEQGDSERFNSHISWPEIEGIPETIFDAFVVSLGEQKMNYAMFESLTSFRLDLDAWSKATEIVSWGHGSRSAGPNARLPTSMKTER